MTVNLALKSTPNRSSVVVMSETIQKTFPSLPERLSGLGELATNLWWSWHPAARMLFKMLDRQAWKESGHNPVKMLKELAAKFLEYAAYDRDYLRHYDLVLSKFRKENKPEASHFSDNISTRKIAPIAYFSAEYGLHHSLPFYAGGLGFLAGDHLKECSDLGMPLVAYWLYVSGRLR